MTNEERECFTWLCMEYEAHRNKLKPEGLAALLLLRDAWNIDKAKEILTKAIEEDEND